ncbi:MAG: hypothetical protein AAFZ15_25045 [Bacteroidota bacterium]
MKKFLLFSLLTLLFACTITDDANAQRRRGKKKKKSSKTDEYFDESGFVNKLWYGGGLTLGYSGGNNQSIFAFGLSPMVGYKVLDDIISVGPRVGFEYNHIRVRSFNGGPVFKTSPLSYNLGIFSRVKAFPNFFAHFEYEYQNIESTDPDRDGFIEIDGDGNIITERQAVDNVYIGAGYNSGGLLGYEILLLYNVNQPETVIDSPFDIRIGFTYKF